MKNLTAYFTMIFLFIILFNSFGCSTVYETQRIRIDTIKVIPPPIIETMEAIVHDTVVVAEKIVFRNLPNQETKADTIIKIKYFPLEKKITLFAKPDTIQLIRLDTINITKIETGYPITSKIGLIFIGLVIGVVIFIIIKIRGN